MNRLLTLVVLSLLLAIGAPACSKKPPEPTAIMGKSVLAALNDLSEAYEKKNAGSFMDKVAKDYKDRQAFTASLKAVFTKYETVRFTVQHTKMIMFVAESGSIRLTFTWDSEWRTAGGRIQKDGGRDTFIFEPKEKKLLAIEGKNPFVPQTGELPGSK